MLDSDVVECRVSSDAFESKDRKLEADDVELDSRTLLCECALSVLGSL